MRRRTEFPIRWSLVCAQEVAVTSSFRFAVVAVAACLFSLTLNTALAAPAGQLELRWSELQPVLKGRRLSIQLTDGAFVEGKYSNLQADALSMQVSKTSEPAKYPKGEARLARPTLTLITLKRHVGWKGRMIGLIAGGTVAAVAAATIHAISKNEVGGWSSTSAAVATAGAGGAIGSSYLIGWLLDFAGSRPEQVVRILPDEASR
jgi:hypothetical protein